MAFLEIKGMLARLLATENLTVEHSPSAKTASFNVATRTMVLPVWETESEDVYNLFVSHEVGHALWTPTDFPDKLAKAGVNVSLANIIEDARIEKMIQKKFPGLRKDYARGYREIYESGWFGTEGKSIDEFGFIDRVNLHYKVGAALLVPFSEEERKFLGEIDKCEDYEDIIEVSEEIQKFVEKTGPQNGGFFTNDDDFFGFIGDEDDEDDEDDDDDGDDDEIGGQTPSCDDEDRDDEDRDDEEDEEEDKVFGPRPGDDLPTGDLNSETQRALEYAMQNMVDPYHQEITYLTAPTYKSKQFVYPVEEVRSGMDSARVLELESKHKARSKYDSFMMTARRDVNHMVQEFDMRKSAEIYSRVQINKTGMLNTGQLHNYKLTDDIFLRQEIAPKGKSHGMVMLLDWSGSMDKIALDTIKQVLVLTQFCRKIQIPFRVFTFTTGKPYKELPGLLHKNEPQACASIVEVLNSNTKSGQLDRDMYNLFLVGYAKRTSTSWMCLDPCSLLTMGGTPLINAMFMSAKILEEFKEETRVDKISFVVVTDGDSARLAYNDDKGETRSNYGTPIMIRGKNSSVFKLNEDYRKTPGSVAQWITATQPSVSITNIFLGGFRECNTYHRNIVGWGYLDSQEAGLRRADFTKHNGLHFTTTHNWPLVALMNPVAFGDTDEEITVEDGATAGKIRTAFKKFLNKKSGSKKVLTAIVESFA